MQSIVPRVVILGTGGTIAGTAADPSDLLDYQAGVLSVDALVAAVPGVGAGAVETQTVAAIDSCHMDHATWVALARALQRQLARADVAGVVITHGTDTLEETAYFLHRCVAAPKPVVLTAAMRPATAPSADGPQNLLDAVAAARSPGAKGVLAVLGGRVFGGADLRKVHGYRVDAFDSGDAGVVALMEDGELRRFREWPAQSLHRAHALALALDPARWPLVDIVTSHAGARGEFIEALVAAGSDGIVVAGTGNGSLHRALAPPIARAQAAGVRVWRSSRCILGGVVGARCDSLPSAGPLTPVQARIELLLELIAERG